MRSLRILSCSVALSLFAGCMPPGQKVLRFELRRGQQVILTTLFDADDRSSVSEIWDAAGEVPFATETASPALQPLAENPLQAELAGPVTIRIIHVDTLETSATLPRVLLVRSTPTSDDWRLHAAEIARAKKAASRRSSTR